VRGAGDRREVDRDAEPPQVLGGLAAVLEGDHLVVGSVERVDGRHARSK
jgi:hypothetical protein